MKRKDNKKRVFEMDTNSLFSFILIISIIGAFLCITGFIGTNMISKRMSYNYLSIILIISVNWRPARNSNIPGFSGMNAQIAEREDKSNPLFQYGYIAQHRKRKWMSNLKGFYVLQVQALIKILALIILSLVTAVHWVCFNQMYISKLLVFCYVIIYAWMILGAVFRCFVSWKYNNILNRSRKQLYKLFIDGEIFQTSKKHSEKIEIIKTFLRDKDLMEIASWAFMDYYELVVETKERLLDDIHNKISIHIYEDRKNYKTQILVQLCVSELTERHIKLLKEELKKFVKKHIDRLPVVPICITNIFYVDKQSPILIDMITQQNSQSESVYVLTAGIVLKEQKIYISKRGENQETENSQRMRNVFEEVIDKFTVDEEEICL